MTTSNSSIIKKLILLFLVFAGLYYAQDFLMPLCIGGILATLFLPFCNWMERKRVPRWLAAFICLLIVILAIGSLVALLSWKIAELTNDIVLLKQKATEVADHIQAYLLDHLGISVERQSQILTDEKPSFSKMMQMMAGSFTFIFTNLILVLVYVFFLLYYRTHIKKFFIKLSTPSQRSEMELMLNSSAHVSQQYLLGLSKMIVCLWIMYGIGFSIIGVKSALFFAVLCGILEIVPFIGNITGTLLTVVVTALHGGSLPMLGAIVVTYGIVQFIQGWFLEPLIVGHQVKINPLFTIIALVIGELVWGVPGIILAIPLTAIFKIICDHIEPLKPYGFLIGEIQTSKKKSN
jgi:predicted PurR-regulated permease PerM